MPIKYALVYHSSEQPHFVKYTMLIKHFTFLLINIAYIKDNNYVYYKND